MSVITLTDSVPPPTGQTLCWTPQPLDQGMARCDRVAGHKGLHTWEVAALTWQPIETAPKGDRTVIVYGKQFGVAYWGTAHWFEGNDGSSGWIGQSFLSDPPGHWTTFSSGVTHWTPVLPAPPAGETQEPAK